MVDRGWEVEFVCPSNRRTAVCQGKVTGILRGHWDWEGRCQKYFTETRTHGTHRTRETLRELLATHIWTPEQSTVVVRERYFGSGHVVSEAWGGLELGTLYK